MPHDPLIFIHVALTKELRGDIMSILKEESPDSSPTCEEVKCAMFYSITSQPGLSGIDLGNFLIKRVVRELQAEFGTIKIFSTLSPIPGFRQWLANTINIKDRAVLDEEEEINIKKLEDPDRMSAKNESGARILGELIHRKDWFDDPKFVEVLKPILMRLCARYLITEKHRNAALDPVAQYVVIKYPRRNNIARTITKLKHKLQRELEAYSQILTC
ncbi:11269_t:CDS:2 [Acaulospora colombiana]|uniref:11269_t:CDS:1 n=1 Tax=Acaulospora colombiana TaxID=27376 RepID=A0ACA9JW14_9GLOM|nr:11269_t:CDS:2 [Acaulospora colombiana]